MTKPKDTAPWYVKGDGIAYTTSKEILASPKVRRQLEACRWIKLNVEIKD